MLSIQEFLSRQEWLVFKEEDNPAKGDPNSALSYQDSFIRWLPQLNDHVELPKGILHFYPNDFNTVLLGAKDTRLTELANANAYLTDQSYSVVQRPHGGLAVVNDPGVINFGIVSDNRYFKLSIDDAYEQMVRIVAESLKKFNLTVESYEIPDSYCPGKYDLVVNGQKIGGIAQRRFKSGVATAAYISVNGDQNKRAELIQSFYRIGEATADYPLINPSSMTTIEAAIGSNISVSDYQAHVIEIFKEHSHIEAGDFDVEQLHELYNKAYQKIADRSQKIQPNHLP
ncbi:biotin/lipoate A/B protein ligase family protein [Aerococcaceae bacterium WGS1372]